MSEPSRDAASARAGNFVPGSSFQQTARERAAWPMLAARDAARLLQVRVDSRSFRVVVGGGLIMLEVGWDVGRQARPAVRSR